MNDKLLKIARSNLVPNLGGAALVVSSLLPALYYGASFGEDIGHSFPVEGEDPHLRWANDMSHRMIGAGLGATAGLGTSITSGILLRQLLKKLRNR